MPKNALFGYLARREETGRARRRSKKLQTLGKPLVFTWEEFGWESPEHARLSHLAGQVQGRWPARAAWSSSRSASTWTSTARRPRRPIYLPMDAWNKSLTWGLGGDQVRIMDRKVEGLLLAAEMFDAVASALGGQVAGRTARQGVEGSPGLAEPRRGPVRVFPLAGRPHGPCRPAGRPPQLHLGRDRLQPPRRRPETGPAGARRARWRTSAGGSAARPSPPGPWPSRSSIPTAGRAPTWSRPAASIRCRAGTKDLVVKDRAGQGCPLADDPKQQRLPGQPRRGRGRVPGQQVPSAGYDTYYLDFLPRRPRRSRPVSDRRGEADPGKRAPPRPPRPDNRRHRQPGGQGLRPRDARRRDGRLSRASPAGRTRTCRSSRNPPAFYDSAKSKAAIDWLAKGPVRAEVRARHALPYLKFETRVSLCGRARPTWKSTAAC